MKYAFLLGKNSELSIAELGALFGKNLSYDVNKKLVFTEELPSPPQEFLNRLGGSFAIIEIFEKSTNQAQIAPAIEKYLKQKCAGKTGKCNFAINLLPERKTSQALKFLLPAVKRALRAHGIKANFMNKGPQNASAVFAAKQGLVKDGMWIAVIEQNENSAALGAYAAVQDFEAYSKRDYGKPFRDPSAGMLPPKLAQIMINLALPTPPPPTNNYKLPTTRYKLIYDPFCGTGTILMETLLMGFNAAGSDASEKMTAGARKNAVWLAKNFNVKTNCKIFTADASSPTHPPLTANYKLPTTNYQLAIVTEPHLGPPLSSFPAQAFLDKLIKDLSTLYLGFFKNLAAWLTQGAPVVFIFPVWTKNPRERVNTASRLVEKIEALGYIKTAFDPLQKTSLFYERPGQTVGREIVRFIKT